MVVGNNSSNGSTHKIGKILMMAKDICLIAAQQNIPMVTRDNSADDGTQKRQDANSVKR